MVVFKTFKAIRPRAEYVEEISCLPYDVMNREEASEMAKGKARSFLRVVRSETDLPIDISPYDEKVYLKARENLDRMIDEEILAGDERSFYYIYRQVMDGRTQTGLVGCAGIDDYINDVIKKHEYTRPEKEEDRINNFYYCNANTEPVFLTYKSDGTSKEIMAEWVSSHQPLYDLISEDGIRHILWLIDDDTKLSQLEKVFSAKDYLYIADGHHRAASSCKVGLKKREESPDYRGDEEFNYFMAVAFPDEELYIMDYNRLVKDLNGLSVEDFLNQVREKFLVEECGGKEPYQPGGKHSFGMYLMGKWYKLTAIKGTFDGDDAVMSLDASILQNNLLAPVLGIADPRTDKRIDFVGGIRGLAELVKRVDNKEMAVAFSLYPVTISDLMKVADTGKVMPPKSTWFEPKLRSGLFIHKLD